MTLANSSKSPDIVPTYVEWGTVGKLLSCSLILYPVELVNNTEISKKNTMQVPWKKSPKILVSRYLIFFHCLLRIPTYDKIISTYNDVI